MKRHLILVLLISVIGLTALAEGSGELEIRAVLDAQVAAWNRGDIEGFMQGYLQSEELVFTSGSRIRRGWQTTLDKYRERYGDAPETMGRLAFGDLELHMLGSNAAWVLGTWKLTWKDDTTEGGVFTLVMKKTADGWKVVHDHTSAYSN